MSPTPTSATAPHIANTILRGGIYWGRVKVEGHSIRESLGTRDPVEAAAKVKRWLADKSPQHTNDEFTFAQVASSWIEQYQPSYTAKTWRRYTTSMRMLKPYFDGLLWEEVSRPRLVDFITERKRGGATNATINRDLAVVSNIFEHAIDQGWSEDNPVHRLSKKARKEKRSPFVIPTAEMIEAVFARMQGTYGDLCRLALLTGMRMDEIVFMTWETNVILDRSQVQLFVTKNGTVRVVNLCPEAKAVIEKQKTRAGYVFVTRNGGHYQRATEMWREIVLRAGAKWVAQGVAQPFVRFRFHDLRHMFAINYLRNGRNLYHLQLEMGHSTIRQTEEYLQYLTAEEQIVAKGVSQQVSHTTAVLRLVR